MDIYDADGNLIDPEEYEAERLGGDEQRTPAEWAKLRRQESATKKAERERDEANRALAFYRAGIDPSQDARLQFFMDGYKGEVDPDAIRTAATEAGFLAPAQQQTAEQAAAQQAAATLGRVDAAASGATVIDGDPVAALDQAFLQGGDRAVEDQLRQQGIPVQYGR